MTVTGKIRVAMAATIEMVFPNHGGVTVVGRGVGKFASKQKGDAMEKARKWAVSGATKNAFSKVSIVMLPGGKVWVEKTGKDNDPAEVREGDDSLE